MDTIPWTLIPALALVLLPIVLTPGVSAILVTRHVASGGGRQGVTVLAGTATGLYCHAGLSAVGLSALVLASATLFTAVRVIGAVYLVGLGIMMLVRRPKQPGDTTAPSRIGTGPVYLQALGGNLLNPRAAAVYLTLPTQFVTAEHSIVAVVFLFATLHIIMLTVWLGLWTRALMSVKRSRHVARVNRVVRNCGGVLLIALGLRTAIGN